jgi:hypothetical protein
MDTGPAGVNRFPPSGRNFFIENYCTKFFFWYSLIMEMTIDPKEFAAEDLAAYAAEYEAWLDELEAIVKEHGNPNIWID